MSDFTFDIDEIAAVKKLTLREKVAIRILLIIFGIVVPFKHSHQVKSVLEPLLKLLEE